MSAASFWEIAIEAGLGKIETDPDAVAATIEPSGFVELPINAAHGAHVARLPPHHHDPFDRILIAQALVEPLRLVTTDSVLTQCGELVVLV